MKNIVAANWKMNGSQRLANSLVGEIVTSLSAEPVEYTETVLCPPYVFLPQVAQQLQTNCFSMGAQDVSQFDDGAFTGQISATMLVEIGCQYVIIGHSERRALCNEQDIEIAAKVIRAQAAGLTPILCVGETEDEFKAQRTEQVVLKQLNAVLDSNGLNLNKFILAYEPVWAIGTGLTATPEQAQNVHHLLRGAIKRYDAQLALDVPIIYGGSVKPDNAAGLFAQPDINGALVGGASLKADAFLSIVRAADLNRN